MTGDTLFDAPVAIEKAAVLSDCAKYRYTLTRRWDHSLPAAVFIGLNPSTADADLDDPTIRRCIRFARDWGYGALVMVNLFASRATDPADLPAGEMAIGPENDRLAWHETGHALATGGIVIAAWGAHARAEERLETVFAMHGPPELHALGTTAAASREEHEQESSMNAEPVAPSTPEPRDLSGCCLGSADDPTGEIYDARSWKRATAIGSFGSEWGLSFTEIQCRTIHARQTIARYKAATQARLLLEQHDAGQDNRRVSGIVVP